MRSLLLGEIDQRDGLFHRAERRIGHRRGRTNEGQHAAVVIRIGLAVQEHHLGDSEDSLHDRINFAGIAAFRKIRDTLNQLSRHLLS